LTLRVSASQVSLFRDGPDDDGCVRKYLLRYVAGIEDPGTKAQALGKEVDDTQLQPYLKEGRPFDLDREAGQIAQSGLEWLPAPKHPGLEVQKEFVMPSPTKAFGWRGYLDLWLPQRGLSYLDAELTALGHTTAGVPIVSDFKTSSNLTWAKTPEQLAKDPQAQLYATWAMWKTKARTVDLVWIYLQTKGARKAKRVHLRVDGDHVFRQFSELEKTGKQILEVRERALEELGPKPEQARAIDWAMQFPPNTNACGNFGGCPHRHICNLSPAQFVDSIDDADFGAANKRFLPVMQEEVDLFADLAARSTNPDDATKVLDVVGINPPEKDLPLAPPTGIVDVSQPSPEPDKTKAKKGRKPKAELIAALPPPSDPPEASFHLSDITFQQSVEAAFIEANQKALELLRSETDLDTVTRYLNALSPLCWPR
jgi:hypothetical protein